MYTMLSPGDSGTPLEEVEFLARSPNRIDVLDALTDGPRERYDLEESTGVSRATLGRILEDFEERGWVVEDDRRYEATQLGAYVAREFTDLLARFGPVPALNEVARWFPDEGFEFSLRCLADAEVVRPTRNNALAPTTSIASRLRNADRARILAYTVIPAATEACHRGTVEGDLEFEGVFAAGALDAVEEDPHLVEQTREILETGRAEVYFYPGDVDSTVIVADDLVLLCLSGGEGAPRAVIETENGTVRSWAESRFESYRDEAEPLEPSLFAP